MKKLIIIMVIGFLFITSPIGLVNVNAERTETGKCAITITTDHTSSNRAQATGPCKGYLDGYHHYQNGHDFRISGHIDTSVNNGEVHIFHLPPPAGDYYDYQLTVTTVVKEQPKPKPDPKPTPEPEPKPEPKPEKKPTPKPESKPEPKATPKQENKLNSGSSKSNSSNKFTNQEKETSTESKTESKNSSVTGSESTSNSKTVVPKTEDKLKEKAISPDEKENDSLKGEIVVASEDDSKSKKTKVEGKEKEDIKAAKLDNKRSNLPVIFGATVFAGVLMFGGVYVFNPTVKGKVNEFLQRILKRKN